MKRMNMQADDIEEEEDDDDLGCALSIGAMMCMVAISVISLTWFIMS